jgi:hypothetical protein
MDQGGINVGDRQALARLMEQVPGLMGATAYHGTPHNIRGQFDISKVGTGEGAQAYGHGMYFAENPAVAKQYATPNDEIVAKAIVNNIRKIYDQKVETGGTSKEAINEARNQMQYMAENAPTPTVKQLYYDGVNNVERIVTNPLGNVYKVDIPDEYIPNMLDWDKPLTQQSSEVRKALAQYMEGSDTFISPVKGSLYNPTGKQIYEAITKDTDAFSGKGSKIASEQLNQLGIKGIRYLDEGSRVAGKGTSNYVVFDPTDVKILEKNSQKVEGLLD